MLPWEMYPLAIRIFYVAMLLSLHLEISLQLSLLLSQYAQERMNDIFSHFPPLT